MLFLLEQNDLNMDWDESAVNYTCYTPNQPLPVKPEIQSKEECDTIPLDYYVFIISSQIIKKFTNQKNLYDNSLNITVWTTLLPITQLYPLLEIIGPFGLCLESICLFRLRDGFTISRYRLIHSFVLISQKYNL